MERNSGLRGDVEVRYLYRYDEDTGYRIQDTGYKIQDTGYRIQDTRYKIQDTCQKSENRS